MATKATKQLKPLDCASLLADYESGELTEDECIDGFQQLIDSGVVWTLQGRYGRTAASLIRAGHCADTHGVL